MAHLESFVQENARDALWQFFPQRLGFRQALVSSDWIDPITVAPLAWLR